MVAPVRTPVRFEDLLLRGDADRREIIGGEIVEQASPSPGHSLTNTKLAVVIDPFNRRPGSRGPGGW